MNRYKVAETIVSKIIEDLRTRLAGGVGLKLDNEETQQEITERWEDIVLLELEPKAQ